MVQKHYKICVWWVNMALSYLGLTGKTFSPICTFAPLKSRYWIRLTSAHAKSAFSQYAITILDFLWLVVLKRILTQVQEAQLPFQWDISTRSYCSRFKQQYGCFNCIVRGVDMTWIHSLFLFKNQCQTFLNFFTDSQIFGMRFTKVR